MSEHFHYIEDLLSGKTMPDRGMVAGSDDDVSDESESSESSNESRDIPYLEDPKPREIEIGIVNRKPLYIVFRLDKLKLWGVSDE